MKTYFVVKPLMNARKKRILEPGETIDFDDAQAAILMERGCIVPAREMQAMRAKRYKHSLEPQLDKLKDNDL